MDKADVKAKRDRWKKKIEKMGYMWVQAKTSKLTYRFAKYLGAHRWMRLCIAAVAAVIAGAFIAAIVCSCRSNRTSYDVRLDRLEQQITKCAK